MRKRCETFDFYQVGKVQMDDDMRYMNTTKTA